MSPADPLLGDMLQAIEADLQLAVESLGDSGGGPLPQMLAHHFGWEPAAAQPGGKRLRPLLALLTCQGSGGDWHLALPAASALELVHNFSLVHDDIQDRSETRHSRPTLWAIWGDPQAINAGDALFALARRTSYRLLELGLQPGQVLQIQRELDDACLQLTIGQHLDLAFEGQASIALESYLLMVEAKTASLLAASAAAGSLVAGASAASVADYRAFGHHLGIAFQIHDDVLGIWGDPAITGKPAGDDLLSHKISFPVLAGLHDSAAFHQLWSSGRDDPTSLQAMTEALIAVAADQQARQAAAQHSSRAVHSLRAASPRPPAAQQLELLVSRLLERSR